LVARKPEFVGKIIPMGWIFLSPHCDDVALSLGGWVWEQAHASQAASIWTVCAGEADPAALSPFAQALHNRWGILPGAAASRREEDRCSCERLGATYRYLSIPDCIYRGSTEPFYPSEESLWGDLHPAESSLLETLSAALLRELPPEARLVCPLALGHHVDHQLTRRAAEAAGRPLWYYADYPYALQAAAELEGLKQAGWQAIQFPVTEAACRPGWKGRLPYVSDQHILGQPGGDAAGILLFPFQGGISCGRPTKHFEPPVFFPAAQNVSKNICSLAFQKNIC
jgi:LmbE family N-acetylglucosaminyl deacetylase